VLNGGQTVGFFLSLRMIGPGGQYPQDFADTDFPGFRNYASILICAYSPQQRIALLQQDVSALVSSGVLTTADTKLMLRSLDDALNRLSQQKVKQAIDELEKFIKEVDKLVKKGKLTTAQGQTLIAAATTMINQLSTPNLAKSRNEAGVQEAASDIPAEFGLEVNYPNPFNPKTIISYQIPAEGLVTLRVYNLLGQEVASLVNGNLRAGRHSVAFDASHLPSGTYMYTLQFGDKVASKAMVLMK
jgi:polyhydroxyalkanoate synthesis regulator phasin